MKKSCLIIVALFVVWGLTHIAVQVESANAAGFALYEYGNRANGMGGAVIASQDAKPSAIAYNPAGITQLEGVQTQIGSTFIAPSADVTVGNNDTVTTKGKVYAVPHAYVTYQLSDDWYFGFGEFTRFGLGTNYDHDWAGCGNVYKASVESFSFQPTIAWKAHEQLSLAFGLEYIMGSMDIRRNIKATGEDLHQLPEGSALTWVAAAQYDISQMVSLGLVYRKGFVFEADGDFLNNDEVIGDMSVDADFPSSFNIGLSVKPMDKLTIEADAIITFWSDFEAMHFQYDDDVMAGVIAFGALPSSNVDSIKEYNDTIRLQFGAEYEAWDGIFLRGGYTYDESPQNSKYTDYMLPASDRHLISLGLGWQIGDWSLDFSYVHLSSEDYEIDNDVVGYTEVDNGVTHIGGLNFSYKF